MYMSNVEALAAMGVRDWPDARSPGFWANQVTPTNESALGNSSRELSSDCEIA